MIEHEDDRAEEAGFEPESEYASDAESEYAPAPENDAWTQPEPETRNETEPGTASGFAASPAQATSPPADSVADRLQEIQLAFVDDPRQAALDADDLLAEALRSFADDVGRRRRELEAAAQDGDGVPDTEHLRLAVRRSRELIEMLAQSS